MTKALKNPRSALCKTAVMASADIFKGYRESLLDILDPLVLSCFQPPLSRVYENDGHDLLTWISSSAV